MATEDQVQTGDLFIVEAEVSMPEIAASQMLNPLEAHTNNSMDVEQSVGMLAEAAATQDMYQLVAPMETSESIRVVQAVAEVANATKQDKFAGAGQMYEVGTPRQGIFLDDKFEDVGGFSVLKTQASLYRKIWLRYGHIPSSRVLKDIYASQVAVVSDIMTSIVDMDRCHPRERSSEFIDSWEKNIEVAEKLEFNIGWLRERLEDIKKSFAAAKKLQDTETEWAQAKAHVDEAEQQLALAKNGLNMAKERLSTLEAKISPLRMERQNFEEKCRGSLLLFDCGTSLSLSMPIEEPIDNNSNTGPSTIDKDAMPAEGPIDKDYLKTAPCTVGKDATLAEDAIDNNSKAVPFTVENDAIQEEVIDYRNSKTELCAVENDALPVEEPISRTVPPSTVEKDAIQVEEAIDSNSAAPTSRRTKTLKRKSSGDGTVVGGRSEKKPKTSTDGCAAATSQSITDYCPVPSRSVSPDITSSAPTAKQVFTEDEIMAVLKEHPVITSQELADVFKRRLITKEDKLAFYEVMSRWIMLIKKQNSGD